MMTASLARTRVTIRSSYAAYDRANRTFTVRDIGLEGFGFDPDTTAAVWVASDATGRLERFDIARSRSTAGERVYVCWARGLVLVVELVSRKVA